MNLIERTKQLAGLFSLKQPVAFPDAPVDCLPFSFVQEMGMADIDGLQQNVRVTDLCAVPDATIHENKYFSYSVFTPRKGTQFDRAILMLHGLNERSWDKYLVWAEDLVRTCGVPVILFPLAFHMNRTPVAWTQPRWLMPWVNKRKAQILNLCNASFCNVALSARLSDSPSRFYVSGRETIFNVEQLVTQIKQGAHPLFKEGTHVDIFAYSVGALLSQVMLSANPGHLLDDTRLFTFCGGSLFEKMNGNARDIIDQDAYEAIRSYYLSYFVHSKQREDAPFSYCFDAIEQSFKWMIAPDVWRGEREGFFAAVKDRVKMLTLRQDTVVPTLGARQAVGSLLEDTMVEELDFPFAYSHQVPFPTTTKIPEEVLQASFRSVFDRAGAFLA